MTLRWRKRAPQVELDCPHVHAFTGTCTLPLQSCTRSERTLQLLLLATGIRSQTVEVSGELDSLVSDSTSHLDIKERTIGPSLHGYLCIDESTSLSSDVQPVLLDPLHSTGADDTQLSRPSQPHSHEGAANGKVSTLARHLFIEEAD